MVAELYFGFRVGGTLYIKFHGHQWHLSSANYLPLSQVFMDLLIFWPISRMSRISTANHMLTNSTPELFLCRSMKLSHSCLPDVHSLAHAKVVLKTRVLSVFGMISG